MNRIVRVLNGLRKVAAGLRPFNESVWPGVRNDLFVAHESIYQFAATYSSGRRVLDAGCGTGYGTALLAQSAAAAVGVDIDARSIAYARRRFRAANLRYAVVDLQQLQFDDPFDLIVASNSLEHLEEPRAFLSGARRSLRPGGLLLIAVPPIYGADDLEVHSGIHYHRSNLPVAEWHQLMVAEGFQATAFVHQFVGAGQPDLASPVRSRLRPSDFSFTPIPADAMAETLSITAIFLAVSEGTVA